MTTTTIKAVYKQTKIGVIPEDWGVGKIGDEISITTGSRNTQDKVDNGKYPFFVRSQTVERINTYSFDGEAVLTAGDGVGTGKVFHYINGKFDFHQRVYKMSNFGNRVDGFYFYVFFSNNFLKRITAMTAKSSVDSVRMEMIADMEMPLPPKPEQQAIATVLSDTDDLIRSLSALIAKKRQIKEGAMQELLTGKKRLAGYSGEWEVKKLGEESVLVTKGTTPTSLGRNFTKSGVNFVKVESLLKNGNIDFDMLAYIDEQTHGLLKRSQINKNDLLISIAGALGRVAIAKENILPANTNQALAIVRLSEISKLNMQYIFYYLHTKKILKHIEAISVQGAQPNLSLQNIYDLPIFSPPTKEEQQAIAEILSDMDSEITALEQKREKYRLIKQGMMQQLLMGKIRLVTK